MPEAPRLMSSLLTRPDYDALNHLLTPREFLIRIRASGRPGKVTATHSPFPQDVRLTSMPAPGRVTLIRRAGSRIAAEFVVSRHLLGSQNCARFQVSSEVNRAQAA
jgi:hypothetical protein